MKSLSWLSVLAFVFLVNVAALGQEFPAFELAAGYSFVNVHPNLAPITSFNVNGGGAAFVYNFTSLIGIKVDFMAYDAGSTVMTCGAVAGNCFHQCLLSSR